MGFLEERDLSDVPTIRDFYKGKTLFVTGATGFMGQGLIEKLLYACGDLDRIYILLRPKRGQDVQERVKSLYTEACFERLRNERPGVFESKVFGVAGDISSEGLGLSKEDRELLINNVNIIFHSAASVRFDDFLPKSVDLNLKGTLRVIQLAKEVRNLLSLVHVSTCYTNTNYGNYIEEKLYPPHANWRDVIDICDNLDLETVNSMTDKLTGGLPNTYVFTKQLAEHAVSEEKGVLPIVIIRPSVVVSSYEEPIPGWINNFNGPVGIQVATGKGLLGVLYGDPDVRTDYIALDFCIKHFVAAAWIRGTKKLEPTDDVEIYSCSININKYNSFSLKQIVNKGLSVNKETPITGAIRYPEASITASGTCFYLQFMLFQLPLAILIDTILLVLGKKTLLIKIQRRIFKAQLAVAYYMKSEWVFDNENFIKLRSVIKEDDRDQFYYELEVDFHRYYKHAITGAKRFLLKENDDEVPKQQAHLFRLLVLKYVLRVVFLSLLAWTVYNSKCFQNLLQQII